MSDLTNYAKFTTMDKARALKETNPHAIFYNAGTSKRCPFLNPFHFSSDYLIPVPKMEGVYSHSVESIWQGLKIVDGKINPEMFKKRAHKRPSTLERLLNPNYKYEDSIFLYGNETIDLTTARRMIYVPAYTFLFNNYIPRTFKEKVRAQLEYEKEVYFYDVDDNEDIDNPHESLAHASLLVDLINQYVQNSVSIDIKKVKITIPLEQVLLGLDYHGHSLEPSNQADRFQIDTAYMTYLSKRVDVVLRSEGYVLDIESSIGLDKNKIRESYKKYSKDGKEISVIKSYSFKVPLESHVRSWFIVKCPQSYPERELIEKFKRENEGTSLPLLELMKNKGQAH